MNNQPRELLVLTEASRALASVRTIDDAKDLRDRAEAVKAYARKARLGKEIFVEASIIKAQAERKLGQMLGETELANSAPGNQHTSSQPVSEHDTPPTLDSLGLTKSDSSRLQKLSALPLEAFNDLVAKSSEGGREVTTAGLLRLAKQFAVQQEPGVADTTSASSNRGPSSAASSLADLIADGEQFATIYADPPWPYNNQATRAATSNHYPSMSIDAICAEPVEKLSADNAHLHLWTTNAFLLDAFDVLEAWGFEYKSCFIWVKPQMGLGNYWRLSHEFLMFGIRGSLKFADRGQKSWLSAKRTQHSRKPEAVRQLVELVSPPRYLEMYGRQLPLNPDWTVYGNQLPK